MENEVKLIDMNTMWQCETCFHKGPNGCKTWCDAGEAYRPAASKLKVIDPESLRPMPRPLEDWGEDYGDVLWWKFPIEEPPYVGSPLDEHWPGYHTHWTPIPVPKEE